MMRAVATILLLLAGPAFAQDEGPDLRAGRAILVDLCGACHAVGAVDDSRMRRAPPFRELLLDYPASDLEESLAEGIVTGHPEMPEVVLEPTDIRAVVGYLDALAVVMDIESD